MSARIRRQITLLPRTDELATRFARDCNLPRSHWIECAILHLADVMTAMKADHAAPFNSNQEKTS